MSYQYDLSVILPVYNVEKYLSNCLDSLLAQRFNGRWQVILVNDKSTDSSLDICQKYASKYEHFILCDHFENGGSAVARNTGLEKAQGEYYIFVDPDDLLPVDAFEVLYRSIVESGADIVKGSNESFGVEEIPKKAPYSVNRTENYKGHECLTVLLKHEKLRGHPWGKIFRASMFSEERFTPGYRMAQDLLYCAQLFSKANYVMLIPDIVYKYRIHSGGATGKKYETRAYLSWLKCVSQIQVFISEPSQQRAYEELKIRTLTQISREARGLKGENLEEVFEKIVEVKNKWVPSFLMLVFKNKISFRSMVRYFKFSKALKQINHKVKG